VTVQNGKRLQRVPVQVGLVTATQAAVTPIGSATLAAGDKVVTAFSGTHKGSGQGQHQQQGNGQSTNPLAGGSASRGATRGLP
jgi:hypothetical protein